MMMLQQVVMRKEVWSLCLIKLQSSVEVLERLVTGKICNLVLVEELLTRSFWNLRLVSSKRLVLGCGLQWSGASRWIWMRRRRLGWALVGRRGSVAPGRRSKRPRLKRVSGRRARVGLQGDVERSQAKKMGRLVEESRSCGRQSWRTRTLPRLEWVPCSIWRGARASSIRRRRAGKIWVSRTLFARITKLTTRAGKIKRRMTGKEEEAETVAHSTTIVVNVLQVDRRLVAFLFRE